MSERPTGGPLVRNAAGKIVGASDTQPCGCQGRHLCAYHDGFADGEDVGYNLGAKDGYQLGEQAAEARIVAWLRAVARPTTPICCKPDRWADAIERREHRNDTEGTTNE